MERRLLLQTHFCHDHLTLYRLQDCNRLSLRRNKTMHLITLRTSDPKIFGCVMNIRADKVSKLNVLI